MRRNKRKRVCLFTAHSPLGGGGGAILRSLVASLQAEVEIDWRYLASKPVQGYGTGWLGRPIIGRGGPGGDFIRTGLLLAGFQRQEWRSVLARVQAIDCDSYWIVSHNEGLCLARDLLGLTSRPIHLTVHDDWGGALCAGSHRYRLLTPLAKRATDATLKRVGSVDVVSEGMRRYYLRRTGMEAEIVHRPIPWKEKPRCTSVSSQVYVGHLGSIYSKNEFLAFLATLKAWCDQQKCSGKVIAWGSHLRPSDIPREFSSYVEFRPTGDEDVIIDDLQQCSFVYAMYPFAARHSIFVKTSFPTKLSSYVMAQRPILGHGPDGSTLASFLQATGVGVVWSNLDVQAGQHCLTEVLRSKADKQAWSRAQKEYFGDRNVQRMREIIRSAGDARSLQQP